ncbi:MULTISPECIES: DUF6928 family protein [Nocardiaceae]|uniref:DUF6928 family protein n=1 Tax=Nocardiaceae TaxID=85025 RepID=UPI000B9BBB33|nr:MULTISPECIES: hypothetical protein [Rhodococcus]MBY4208415.1 hypothetical protein [Rhodococcus fascians]MDR6908748.1 hypothetical protein [Rhodococcus sp. 3258]MDR6930435.1 hypothetical protein [Rhodococcus fascians]OZD56225.1 hypothetical protein CH268_24750 [Rhodococcus sp. 06-1460-1B]
MEVTEREVPVVGAKASTIWYVDAPDPISVLREATTSDWNAASALVGRLYPHLTAVPLEQGPISTSAGVDDDHVFIGCYPGVTVVCGSNLSVPTPSTLPESVTRPLASEHTYLVASDPEHAWGAFAYWERGEFRRSFSATPVYIYEDVGLPLVWERPFWAGDHPLIYPPGVMPDPQSLPFHPQEFAEAANAEWLGFRYTGAPKPGELDPNALPVCGFTMYVPGQEPRPQTVPVQNAPAADSAEPAPRPKKRWFSRK